MGLLAIYLGVLILSALVVGLIIAVEPVNFSWRTVVAIILWPVSLAVFAVLIIFDIVALLWGFLYHLVIRRF